jgi:hypothetical protein
MEELRRKLINLIEIKGVLSEEVIKVSTELDELIVKHYEEIHNNMIQESIDEYKKYCNFKPK